MRVTQFLATRSGRQTTFSADFIFSRPFGGKREKCLFWIRWVVQACSNPVRVFRHGVHVRRRVWFSIPSKLTQTAQVHDAFFLLALPLAIATHEDLYFEAPVSADLLRMSKAMHVYYREVAQRKIHIHAPRSKRQHTPSKQVAQFFTLGVDSFYSLYRTANRKSEESKNLIYVDGYDVPFYEKRFLKHIHHNINAVAKKTGMRPLYVETNLRLISDAIVGWGRFHVSALVACGTLLGIGKLLISGESFDAPDWGLRTGVDALYSRKNQKVTFIGHAVSREYKMKKILQSSYSKLFLQYVRVCWENVRFPNIPYNCSICQKCIKTQLTLLALGVAKTPTFLPLQITALRNLRLVEHVYAEWQALYKELQKNPQVDPVVLWAMREVLEKPLRR